MAQVLVAWQLQFRANRSDVWGILVAEEWDLTDPFQLIHAPQLLKAAVISICLIVIVMLQICALLLANGELGAHQK